MRRYPLLFLLFASIGAARAQTSPSITAADMPAVGDSLRLSQAALTLPASAPPLTRNGADQTWNYAGLVATSQRVDRYDNVNTTSGLQQLAFGILGGVNRATLVAPRALPAAAGAALPVTDPLEFFNLSASDFRSVGFGATLNGLALPVTYASQAQQDIIYRFPLSYASTPDVSNSYFQVSVPGTGFASQKRRRTNQPDAWGTLTTPFGTFQTVRVVTTLADHDSVAIGAIPGQGLDLPVRREYKWLAPGVHVPVLTITTLTVAGQEAVALVEYRDVLRRFVRLATLPAAADAVLSAYPSPSAVGSAVHLALPAGSGELTVVATDLAGRQVFSRHLSGAGGLATLDAAAFGGFRGVLLLTITTAQGTATRRVVRQ
ncbi:hypothetical protein GO988_19550 [Hymenobacter sp. HMF4947]|uniref:T9SS type A sorting domain-containing protein n=1 Tax=Hymenobacter ginkgonis TaxID=2682976 RepID=A0A7K1TJJ2_9BACT|nr:T9SS type A sorting domain-containing protein [Hymenobacter ginkgonis]MVN78533.1 hypothetical protein [Hymenobacter ginkgonis]